MSEAPVMQDCLISPDLEDLYMECGDILTDDDYMTVPDLSRETTEPVTKEVEELHATEEAQRLFEDSEPELEEEKPAQELQSTQRKREYKKKFDKAREHARIITDEEIRLRKPVAADEHLSLREILHKGQSHTITDPREYQLELFERAKKQNIIAVLDTGSGKTLIAVLLLRHILDQELEDRSGGKKPRIAFFLVDSVALVFQQYEVLNSNLDQPINCFCGDMNPDHWGKSTWEGHLKENMVIVCTAEILYQCLMRSFIRIDQINLLIFDEAHHAKKSHPYARIIKDFYIPEDDQLNRPKIFGMTASPVDVRSNFTQAAKNLEDMLHCQIATTADLTLLRMSVSRPNECLTKYPALPLPFETELYREMQARYGDLEVLTKIFSYAKEASSQLGQWCADQVWSFAMAEHEALKFERRVEKNFSKAQDTRPVEILDDEMNRLREAQKFVMNWDFTKPTEGGNGLSSKVSVLRQWLDGVFERPTNDRCIVFVDRRYTARLLHDLFARIGTSHLRAGLLVGARNGEPGDRVLSVRQQILTLSNFRKGLVNCLFATSIAEEGLDIPECNMVIRFDLYRTLIQYIQSRGRARHAESRYIHMVEEHNQWHFQAIRDVRQGEDVMRKFCESLPADRLLQGNDSNLGAVLEKEKNLRVFVDPESGAKLTYASSLAVLAHFVSCLPNASSSPNYNMTAEHGQYTCEIILPESSPIHSATGRPSSRKAIAKRSAAFEACLLLRKGGHLDENLLSTHHKHLPAMRNAHLALNLNKSSRYEMKVKPKIWEDSRGLVPESLFMTIFRLEEPEKLGRESQPIALMTRTRMPQFPCVLLHLQADQTSNLTFASLRGSLQISQDALLRLNAFTLRLYKDIFNKTYEVNDQAMSYWFAPVVKDFPHATGQRGSHELLDWAVLDYVYKNEAWQWNIHRQPSELEGRYLVDRWDGGRRFWSLKVLPDLRPRDPVPPDATAHKYMDSILDYSVSLFPKARKRAVWLEDQPVIYAHRILHRLNWLDEFSQKDLKVNNKAYVCPEPLLFSALPSAVVAMAYLIPSAISRVESFLIALEACDMLGLTVRPDLALEAITKDSENTEEHRGEQIHFQRGMGKNYERLEFIGDCFLKMATSISIFCLRPENDEFDYHVRRMVQICNKNLLDVALKKKLYKYIRSVGFSRRNWYPQGIKLLEGKGINKIDNQVYDHTLGDKTIADVCEALIGASLLSSNNTGNMDMAVKAVTVLVSHPDHDVAEWADYYKLYTKPSYQIGQVSAVQTNLALQIHGKTGYRFKYPRLLMSAFVHPSLPSSGGIPCYQRLEFLGDSLLDMACVNFLFHRHPDRDPQWLTEHKMAMVSNKFLAALAVKLGFHTHIRYSGTAIEWQKREYAQEAHEVELEHHGARDYWTATRTPPKCLADVVESYLGAVFVDSEFDFSEIERFFDDHVRWFFEDMSIYDTFANHHPVTHLHHHLVLSLHCSNYKVMASAVPNAAGTDVQHQVAVVMVHGEVVASGMAASSKNAKVKACERALEVLKPLLLLDFRQMWGCDCVEGEDE
ncbi:MAG: hypothetical protein Q9216_006725, partial [Gyalolechia sp. 2 TL-2023]